MLFWLPEAAGVSNDILKPGYLAALSARENCASQTAAIRKEIPWSVTFQALVSAAPVANFCATVAEKSSFRDA